MGSADSTRTDPHVSVVIPCLDEAETLAGCIAHAHAGFASIGVRGEVVVADNGSTDASRDIALRAGARVVDVPARGYGRALRAGISAARGAFVVVGDADGSYDFSAIGPFVDELRAGNDLVMGNRFLGRIMPGAMPWSHRHIGNPVLSAIGRLFFRSPVGDFHCGLRAITKQASERLNLASPGMEFASEMVIRSTLLGLRIAEVPITLHRDGRSRRPHLRTWRDGWRHLRFMLLLSPFWLFALPGALLLVGGGLGGLWLLPGARHVAGVELDIHSLLLGSSLSLVGYQLLVFAIFTKQFSVREGLHPPVPFLTRVFRLPVLELGIALGLVLVLGGIAALGVAVYGWKQAGFGHLDPRMTMRQVIPSLWLLAIGVHTVFASFFLGVLGPTESRRASS
jgi:glycosyltransferase involved in cell wall biosynthesis